MSIAPRCTCGHSKSRHGFGNSANNCLRCSCTKWQPKRLTRVRISGVDPPVRAVRPLPKRAAPKRRIMPRCKHCAHTEGKHFTTILVSLAGDRRVERGCHRCSVCPAYAPARGIRQKRRTPAAAIKRIADDLWTRVVHARPERCEVQAYYPHECVGGYQAMHGIPRTYQATRYLPINGFKGCAGVHTYFSNHKEEWTVILLKAWGPVTFDELWGFSRMMQPVDLDSTIASLRAELQAAGK